MSLFIINADFRHRAIAPVTGVQGRILLFCQDLILLNGNKHFFGSQMLAMVRVHWESRKRVRWIKAWAIVTL